jgi:autotransporter-associated beta strand protein
MHQKALAVFTLLAINILASPVPIIVDSFSNDHFTGTSTASGTIITISNNSTLDFQDQSTAGDASISIDGTSILNFAQTASSTYSGTLSGTGSVIKSGTGTLTMTGNNAAFTGPLSVQNGTLYLAGAYGGNVSASSSGNIVYQGPITGNLTVNGGTITTNGFQTLQVQGNYTQTNGGVYIVNTNAAGQSSKIDIQGTANITGGLVQPNVSGGFIMNYLYNILHTAGGLTGTYGLINNYPALKISVTYDPNNVYLSISTNFLGVAATPNQQNVAIQLDNIQSPNADETQVINAVSLGNAQEVQSALDLLSGEQYTNFIFTSLYGDERFSARMFRSYRNLIDPCVLHCSGINNWVSAGGGQAFQNGNVYGRGFDLASFDIAAGMHACAGEPWIVGGALGFEVDSVHSKLSGTDELLTFQGGFYSAFQSKRVYLLTDLIGGISWSDYEREIQFATLDRTAESSPFLTHGRIDLELGFNLGGCKNQVQPYVAASGEVSHQNSIHETDAGSINLNIDSMTKWLASTFLGFHYNYHGTVTLYVDIAWQHDYGNLRVSETAEFEGFGTAFPIQGPERGHDGGKADIMLSLPIDEQWSFYIEAQGEIWKHWGAYQGNIGVNCRW